jgi:hypothetical protein
VLLGEEGEKRVRMGLAKDGSGVGGESPNRFPYFPTSISPDHRSNLVTFLHTHRLSVLRRDPTRCYDLCDPTLTFVAALCALQAKKAMDKMASPIALGKEKPTGLPGSGGSGGSAQKQ